MMSSYSIDDVDFRILQLLIKDSTISHRDIGQLDWPSRGRAYSQNAGYWSD